MRLPRAVRSLHCVSWLLMAALDDDDAPLLTSLFGAEPAAADVLHYGPLRLRVIAKEGALTAPAAR